MADRVRFGVRFGVGFRVRSLGMRIFKRTKILIVVFKPLG